MTVMGLNPNVFASRFTPGSKPLRPPCRTVVAPVVAPKSPRLMNCTPERTVMKAEGELPVTVTHVRNIYGKLRVASQSCPSRADWQLGANLNR